MNWELEKSVDSLVCELLKRLPGNKDLLTLRELSLSRKKCFLELARLFYKSAPSSGSLPDCICKPEQPSQCIYPVAKIFWDLAGNSLVAKVLRTGNDVEVELMIKICWRVFLIRNSRVECTGKWSSNGMSVLSPRSRKSIWDKSVIHLIKRESISPRLVSALLEILVDKVKLHSRKAPNMFSEQIRELRLLPLLLGGLRNLTEDAKEYVLESVNALLVHSKLNAEIISRQPEWQKLFAHFLITSAASKPKPSLEPNSTKTLEDSIFRYTLNVFTIIHQHILLTRDLGLASNLKGTLHILRETLGWDHETSAIYRVMLFSLFKRLQVDASAIQRSYSAPAWQNIVKLVGRVDKYIFFTPVPQRRQLGLHLWPDGTSQDIMLVEQVLNFLKKIDITSIEIAASTDQNDSEDAAVLVPILRGELDFFGRVRDFLSSIGSGNDSHKENVKTLAGLLRDRRNKGVLMKVQRAGLEKQLADALENPKANRGTAASGEALRVAERFCAEKSPFDAQRKRESERNEARFDEVVRQQLKEVEEKRRVSRAVSEWEVVGDSDDEIAVEEHLNELTFDEDQLEPSIVSEHWFEDELWARALFSFKGEDENEVSFEEGDLLQVLKRDPSGWWLVLFGNKVGFVPHNFIQLTDPPKDVARPRITFEEEVDEDGDIPDQLFEPAQPEDVMHRLSGYTKASKCFVCEQVLTEEDMVIQCDSGTIHSECATCCVCGSDQSPKAKGGKLYCGLHFDEMFLKPCATCGEFIRGVQTEAMSLVYHPECLKCSGPCGKPLLGEFFLHNDLYWCRNDFLNVVLSTCVACSGSCTPEDKLIKIGSELYHKWCLQCSDCGEKHRLCDDYERWYPQSINGKVKFRCPKCFEKRFLEPCKGCGELIGVSEGFGECGGRLYHTKCVKCFFCEKRLDNGVFLVNSKISCGEHKKIAAMPPCVMCGVPKDEGMLALGEIKVHQNCVKCITCGASLVGANRGVHFDDTKNGFYCSEHVVAKDQRQCMVCKQSIVEGKLMVLGESFFHKNCLVCLSCGKDLVSGRFGVHADEPFCFECIDKGL